MFEAHTVRTTTPKVLFDVEFQFVGGQSLVLTAEEGRDRIAADDARVRLELHPAPGVTEEVIVSRHPASLAYMRTTRRELQPEETIEDVSLKVVGGTDAA